MLLTHTYTSTSKTYIYTHAVNRGLIIITCILCLKFRDSARESRRKYGYYYIYAPTNYFRFSLSRFRDGDSILYI